MTATDEDGVHRGYLATEDNFAFLKSLESRNLVLPVVGDFGGPKAIRRVGAYLKTHSALWARLSVERRAISESGRKGAGLLPQRRRAAARCVQHVHSLVIARPGRVRLRLRQRVCVQSGGDGSGGEAV